MQNTTLASRSSSPELQGTIHSLPLELLREIFLSATALKFERITEESPIPPRFSTTALAISHVCGHWRFIALSFPELWASIAICCPTEHAIELTKLYLDRSGDTTLLNLSMVDALYRACSHDKWAKARPKWRAHALEIFKLWLPHIRRWVGIHLHLGHMVAYTLLYDIPADALGNLERASVNCDYLPDGDNLWKLIHVSQNLRLVHWPTGGLMEYPSLAKFQHITDLYIWKITLADLTTLPSLPCLVRLAVGGLWPSPEVERVELPALGYLSVDVLVGDSSQFLDKIDSPNLTYLKFRQRVKIADETALGRFLERNNCTLQQLHLTFYHSLESDVLKYLSSAAKTLLSLQSFSLRLEEITQSTVDTLAPQAHVEQSAILFPNLKSLTLVNCRLHDGLLGKMVVAR